MGKQHNDITQRQQEILDRMRSLLAQDGWVVQDVLGIPTYSYTIGRWENRQQPDIVMAGLHTRDMHLIIRDAVNRADAGQVQLELDRDIAGIVSTPVRFRLVPQEIVREHLLAIASLTESGEAVVWQLLVPDPNGRFPGEPGVDKRYEELQDLNRLGQAFGD